MFLFFFPWCNWAGLSVVLVRKVLGHFLWQFSLFSSLWFWRFHRIRWLSLRWRWRWSVNLWLHWFFSLPKLSPVSAEYSPIFCTIVCQLVFQLLFLSKPFCCLDSWVAQCALCHLDGVLAILWYHGCSKRSVWLSAFWVSARCCQVSWAWAAVLMLGRGFWFDVQRSSELVMRWWILMACFANQEVPGKDHYGFQRLSSWAFVRCLRHSLPYCGLRVGRWARHVIKWVGASKLLELGRWKWWTVVWDDLIRDPMSCEVSFDFTNNFLSRFGW